MAHQGIVGRSFMAEHRGVEYAIHWKFYGWEWEVFAHPGDASRLVHGTVVARSQNLADDEWRQVALAGVEAKSHEGSADALTPSLR